MTEEIRELQVPQRQYEQAEYDKAMADVRAFGAADQKNEMSGYEPQNTLTALQTIAHREQLRIIERAGDVDDNQRSPWLSPDDEQFAYKQGANSELHRWYWEQKREHGFGNAASKDGDGFEKKVDAIPVMAIADILASQQEDIKTKAAFLVVPAVEVGAATSYFRGQAEGINTVVRELGDRYPEIVKDLPLEMNVNSIEVRSAIPERRHERALSI